MSVEQAKNCITQNMVTTVLGTFVIGSAVVSVFTQGASWDVVVMVIAGAIGLFAKDGDK